MAEAVDHLWDPLAYMGAVWPHSKFYREQEEIILSIRDSIETYAVGCNGSGKDYVAGAIAFSFFLNPMMYFPQEYVLAVERSRSPGNPFPHTRRVMTTSVKDEHLALLWAEIGKFMTSARSELFGGPLIGKDGLLVVNQREVRFAFERDATEGNVVNFLKGQVSEGEEGLSGLHAAYTLMVGDEASGISDLAYSAGQGWAKRFLFIGNPWPSENFYRRAIDAGDLLAT